MVTEGVSNSGPGNRSIRKFYDPVSGGISQVTAEEQKAFQTAAQGTGVIINAPAKTIFKRHSMVTEGVSNSDPGNRSIRKFYDPVSGGISQVTAEEQKAFQTAAQGTGVIINAPAKTISKRHSMVTEGVSNSGPGNRSIRKFYDPVSGGISQVTAEEQKAFQTAAQGTGVIINAPAKTISKRHSMVTEGVSNSGPGNRSIRKFYDPVSGGISQVTAEEQKAFQTAAQGTGVLINAPTKTISKRHSMVTEGVSNSGPGNRSIRKFYDPVSGGISQVTAEEQKAFQTAAQGTGVLINAPTKTISKRHSMVTEGVSNSGPGNRSIRKFYDPVSGGISQVTAEEQKAFQTVAQGTGVLINAPAKTIFKRHSMVTEGVSNSGPGNRSIRKFYDPVSGGISQVTAEEQKAFQTAAQRTGVIINAPAKTISKRHSMVTEGVSNSGPGNRSFRKSYDPVSGGISQVTAEEQKAFQTAAQGTGVLINAPAETISKRHSMVTEGVSNSGPGNRNIRKFYDPVSGGISQVTAEEQKAFQTVAQGTGVIINAPAETISKRHSMDTEGVSNSGPGNRSFRKSYDPVSGGISQVTAEEQKAFQTAAQGTGVIINVPVLQNAKIKPSPPQLGPSHWQQIEPYPQKSLTRGTTGAYKCSNHSHPNHTLDIAKAELKKALKEASCQSLEGYRAVFDRVCNMTEHKYAAAHMTYASVVSSMQSARSKCFPRVPKSANDFHNLMQQEKSISFRNINGKQFYHGCKENTLFFVVPATLEALSKTASTVLYFDGTYKTKPSIFNQLFMAYAELDHKVFPLAYMPSEHGAPNELQYCSILEHLLSIMPPVTVVGTVTDFEKALVKACRAIFPTATHQGCLFHFKQAVRRRIISDLHVQPTSPEYKHYRMAMQLAHLPPSKMVEGVDTVISHIKRNTSNQEKADSFDSYLRRTWLRNVSPHVYSTYHVPTTSNNAAEAYHSKMLDQIGLSPAAWVFVEKNINMANTTEIDIARVQNLPYKRQQSERQEFVNICTAAFDRDGNLSKFLEALNSNKKNEIFGSHPIVEKELLEALDDCVLCSKCASVSLIPCNHKTYCEECALPAIMKNTKCPVCASPWLGFVKDSDVQLNLN
ncbi:uncharacterized protein LOC109413101 isoform X1 [Aedes albopictus]|uniref:RING-type domain-containing protein n=1 Tax=Aedes albopictus TaxID=7160 RepID=A0ABM1Y3W5_AEDAL